jgi:TPR repeat protein
MATDHNDKAAMESLKKRGIEYAASETGGEICEKAKNIFDLSNNDDEGIAVLSKAAEKSHLESMRILGFIFDTAKKDFEKSAYWYAKVAELGDLKNIDFIESIFRLGEHFMEGKGVPQDLIKAKTLFEKVIASGTSDYQRWSKMRLKKIRTMINKSI